VIQFNEQIVIPDIDIVPFYIQLKLSNEAWVFSWHVTDLSEYQLSIKLDISKPKSLDEIKYVSNFDNYISGC